MGKKIIRLTESDLERIVSRVITEQSEERKHIRAIQRFLNWKYPTLKLVVDGNTGSGSQTEKAIMKYQSDIKVLPTNGVWGIDTQEKMPPSDLKQLKKFMVDEGDIFDRFLDWLGF
jgi:hypothetical protein